MEYQRTRISNSQRSFRARPSKARTLLSFPLIPPFMSVSSPRSAPCSPPRMSNTCYLTAWAPLGLGEAQKASLALPAALVAYLNQPPSFSLPKPVPQHGTLNYCLHLICSLSTKLLSASHFPHTSTHLHQLSVCLCACLTKARDKGPGVIVIGSTFHCPYVYTYWKQADCHCLYLLAFKDIYDNINHFSSLFTSSCLPVLWLIQYCRRSDRCPCRWSSVLVFVIAVHILVYFHICLSGIRKICSHNVHDVYLFVGAQHVCWSFRIIG